MKEPQTTIVYKGITYPFYKTNRGQFDFENAGFTIEEVQKGKAGAMLALVFFNLRDCAKRASLAFTDSFEQFIDDSETDVLNVFVRLGQEREKMEADSKKPKVEK